MIRGKLEGPRESLKYEKARTVCLYLKLTHWSVAHSWLPLVWIPLSFCSCRVSMLFYHQDLGTIFLQTSLNLISQFVNFTIEPTNCLYCKKNHKNNYYSCNHRSPPLERKISFIQPYISSPDIYLFYYIWFERSHTRKKKNSHMRGISSNSIICTIFAPTYERMSKGVVQHLEHHRGIAYG